MQEVLSKTCDPDHPLCGQEFYELKMADCDDFGQGRHVLREAHASWDQRTDSLFWDEFQVEFTFTLAQAEKRYAERRAAHVKRGFIYSDIEL